MGMTEISDTSTASAERLTAITNRLTATPPGKYSWRGNTDHPETLRLDAPRYTDGNGGLHSSTSVLSMVRHEVTLDEARARGVGDPEFFEYPSFFQPPLDAQQKYAAEDTLCLHEAFREQLDDEATSGYDNAYDKAYDEFIEKHRKRHLHDYCTDEYGEPRTEYRLAFTDENNFLVEAEKLAIYEVAPQATSATDPNVYRRDIVGFRHPMADLLANAHDDMAFLLAEVERLTAERDSTTCTETFFARYTAPPQYAGVEREVATVEQAQELADNENTVPGMGVVACSRKTYTRVVDTIIANPTTDDTDAETGSTP